MLSANGLVARFGGIVAVAGVDLVVGGKELVCVIGPNGAGKSTLLDLLCGALQPSSGSLYMGGEAMIGKRPHLFCRAGIVRKFQGANVFQWMSVRDNLEVAGLGAAIEHQQPMVDSDEVLALVKLAPQAELHARTLSHGQRQWLEIGMTLMCRPRVLLLDEPTAGMTLEGTNDMGTLLRGISERCAVIVIEHDMRFVQALGCRTLVMHQGSIIGEGDFETLRRNELVRDVYLGRAGGARAAH